VKIKIKKLNFCHLSAISIFKIKNKVQKNINKPVLNGINMKNNKTGDSSKESISNPPNVKIINEIRRLRYKRFQCITKNEELLNKNRIVVTQKLSTEDVSISLNGKKMLVKREHLTYKYPKEKDEVRILCGKSIGEKGKILGIDGNDAIVKLSII